ncbi:hypothetical protein DRE_00261 [Drechslerella stenobrocha 248]|uniref:AB hydrolase-1 domain-containing protein n=1 Tax=Drechslerella stenobrocha 248 TaxID=1043628 RepID=W7HXR0_9PEZI|nr:hypothetical protein DRE_00261 [Drechslerella stenobrocha 248]
MATSSASTYRQNLHPHNVPRNGGGGGSSSNGSSSNSKSPRSSNPRRKLAPSPLNTAHLSADPEIMASLVESLAKIAPSPQHTLFFEGLTSTNLIPGKDGAAAYTTSADRDHDLLHPEDAATPPIVRTSKRSSTGTSSLKSARDSFMGKRSSATTDVPNYLSSFSLKNTSEEKVSQPPKSILRMSSIEDIHSRNTESHQLQTLKSLTGNMEYSIPTIPSSTVPSVPERKSSYGKSVTSPERMKSKRDSRRHSALASSTAGSTGMQYTTALSTPTSPTQSKHMPRASTSTSSSSLRRQSSLPHSSSHPPVSNHRRSSSGKLRRRSSPPTLAPALSPFPQDDRASTADSIDDAVEAYLCSPRLSQKLRFPISGRTISFSEVGDPNGYAVFICVGMGLTRYVTAFYDELALSLGLRLITPDRPGVGESDAIPESERTVLSWPDDILYICQSLKITKFSLLAHSAGAIYALATALRMPGHIRGKIHLLAPWIPPSQLEAIATSQGSPSPAVVPASQRILRALPTPFLKAANSSFMSATSASLTTSLPKTPNKKKRISGDKNKLLATQASNTSPGNSSARYSMTSSAAASTTMGSRISLEPKSPTIASILERESINTTDAIIAAALSTAAEKERQHSYDERLTHQIWALATRNANPAVDLLVCLERSRPIGFRYVDINRPVVIHHGTKDTRVPVENVKWLGQTMRRCEVKVLPGEGHGLMASASVMGGVLTDIASEWREWKRAVESKMAAEKKVSHWSPLATTPEQREVH